MIKNNEIIIFIFIFIHFLFLLANIDYNKDDYVAENNTF